MLHIMNFKSSCSLPILSATGGLAPCHSFKSSSSLPNQFATGGPASFLSFKSSFSSPILFATGGPAPFHRLERTEQDINKHKIFMVAKGYRGTGKNCTRIAKQRVRKALQYSYRDRNNRKRDMRTLWIQRINAGAHLHGINYEDFMHGLMKQNIQLNRKVLSELSVLDPYSFKALVDISQNAFP